MAELPPIYRALHAAYLAVVRADEAAEASAGVRAADTHLVRAKTQGFDWRRTPLARSAIRFARVRTRRRDTRLARGYAHLAALCS